MKLHAHDGTTFTFSAITFPSSSVNAAVSGSWSQMLRSLNRYLKKSRIAARLRLQLHQRLHVPVGASLVLVQHETETCSLLEAWDAHANALAIHQDAPLLAARNVGAGSTQGMIELLRDIQHRYVPDTVLLNVFYFASQPVRP